MPGKSDPSTPEGSFITPSLKSRQGKFYCGVCGASDIQISYNPKTYVLRIVCNMCGNHLSVNCAPLEAQDGR